MRIWIAYLTAFSLLLMGFSTMIGIGTNPEQVILGEWDEVSWQYARINGPAGKHPNVGQPIAAEEKDKLGGHLIIHQAEPWQFNPDGTLTLHGQDGSRTVQWRIKGRGNVLELKYDNNRSELYDFVKLDSDELILYLELDTHVRGTAKLTFHKSSSYAQKIQQ